MTSSSALPFSSVKSNVRLEITAFGKRFSAVIALIWLFAGVIALMRFRVAQLMEALIAIAALVPFHFRVRFNVAQECRAQLKL